MQEQLKLCLSEAQYCIYSMVQNTAIILLNTFRLTIFMVFRAFFKCGLWKRQPARISRSEYLKVYRGISQSNITDSPFLFRSPLRWYASVHCKLRNALHYQEIKMAFLSVVHSSYWHYRVVIISDTNKSLFDRLRSQELYLSCPFKCRINTSRQGMGIGSPDKRMREYYLTIQMRKMKQCFTGMKFAHCEAQSLPKVWLLVLQYILTYSR